GLGPRAKVAAKALQTSRVTLARSLSRAATHLAAAYLMAAHCWSHAPTAAASSSRRRPRTASSSFLWCRSLVSSQASRSEAEEGAWFTAAVGRVELLKATTPPIRSSFFVGLMGDRPS